MFWDSVASGLGVLLYWETYVAGLEYLAIFFIPMIIVGLIAESNEAVGGAMGCLSILLMPVIQVAAIAIFVLTLGPIIFGLSKDAAWSFPWELITNSPEAFFKLVGVLVVAAIVLAFIPILGQIQSLRTLVLGGIALTFILGLLDSQNAGVISSKVDLIPSFWLVVGLVVIGGLMGWVGFMAAAFVAVGFERFGEGLGQMLVFPIAAIFGFIPVFIYGAWLGAQLKIGM